MVFLPGLSPDRALVKTGTPQVLALVGPTGIGKSEVACALARLLPAEIVSVDSMQVYRGMEIGTGKPPPSVRAQIPHHGLDLVGPEEEFDVVRFVRAAGSEIEVIHRRGRLPLLVGGSGLYLRMLLNGFSPAPGKDPALRSALEAQGAREGVAALHRKLQALDPESGKRIHPNDLRRIVRALEVYGLTRRPLSLWHREKATLGPAGCQQALQIGLTGSRAWLYRRVEARIDGWLEQGWLEECRGLLQRPLSRTARAALGYQELFAYLEGRQTWEETVRLIKRNSRRYAKRQWSWFTADPAIRWLDVEGRDPEAVAQEILGMLF